jgi:predicted nucleic acid-binding protein
MRIPKVYLETTMFNDYFDIDRDAHADTVMLFDECASGAFEPYTSQYVVDEIEAAKDEVKRDKMLSLMEQYGVVVLDLNDEAVRLADVYVAEEVLDSEKTKYD